MIQLILLFLALGLIIRGVKLISGKSILTLFFNFIGTATGWFYVQTTQSFQTEKQIMTGVMMIVIAFGLLFIGLYFNL